MTPTSSLTDPRAKRWGTFAKYAGLLLLGFVVAPYVFTAITGLIGLLAAGALIGGYWMVMPAVETWAGNARLMLVKHAAATNPVPTLQNELKRQQVALDERKAAIGRLDGQIRTFEDKLGDIGRKYGKGDSSYVKLAAQLVQLKRVLANRDEKWKATFVQTQRFEQEIERAAMIWDAAQAAAAAQESSGLTEEDFMNRLKTETSLDTIRTTFNETLASLDTDLMQNEAEQMVNVSPVQAALPAASEANVIDVTPTSVATPVRRKASLT